MSENMKFKILANNIKEINDKTSHAVKREVNQSMPLRNWAIGYYTWNMNKEEVIEQNMVQIY